MAPCTPHNYIRLLPVLSGIPERRFGTQLQLVMRYVKTLIFRVYYLKITRFSRPCKNTSFIMHLCHVVGMYAPCIMVCTYVMRQTSNANMLNQMH